MQNCWINEEELIKVRKELEYEPLNLMHLQRIFGLAFFELLTLCLVDARASGMELGRLIELIKTEKK